MLLCDHATRTVLHTNATYPNGGQLFKPVLQKHANFSSLCYMVFGFVARKYLHSIHVISAIMNLMQYCSHEPNVEACVCLSIVVEGHTYCCCLFAPCTTYAERSAHEYVYDIHKTAIVELSNNS